jgi:hypothetical protein
LKVVGLRSNLHGTGATTTIFGDLVVEKINIMLKMKACAAERAVVDGLFEGFATFDIFHGEDIEFKDFHDGLLLIAFVRHHLSADFVPA